jgi:IMP dehydrogenase
LTANNPQGIITLGMKKLRDEIALSYDDVLLVPKYSEVASRSNVDLSTKISPNITLKIPLIPTKMECISGVKMGIKIGQLGGMAILPRFETPESQAQKVSEVKKENVVVAAAVGIKAGYLERAEMLVNAGADAIDVDVAHGHMKRAMNATKAVRDKFPQITIIAGVAATGECAEDLYNSGADSVLVGIGAGATCITRQVTGCGVPGLQSLFDVAPVAKKHGKTFIPDAGIRGSADIVKALAAGAHAIVGGRLFAAVDETPGAIIEVNGKKYKEYNGSASQKQKMKHMEKYDKNKDGMYVKRVEGVAGLAEYRGPLEDYLVGLLAGVRSGFSYCGAHNLEELHENAEFIRITPGGKTEGGAHDLLLGHN